MKQRLTIVNQLRGTAKQLLLDRKTCRLSTRQARETFQRLAVPGLDKAGPLGEYPPVQRPPECDGEEYTVVQAGEAEGGMSNLYFLPVGSVDSLRARVGRE
jgi:hypothetical protein